MTRIRSNAGRETAADPGTPGSHPQPEHPGSRDGDAAVVDCGLYVNGHRVAGRRSFAEEVAEAAKHEGGFVWLGLFEPTEQALSDIARTFDLPPLAVEDAVNAHQRPKLEQYDDTSFFVLKSARYVEHAHLTETSDVVETGEVMIFIGGHFVVTVRHGQFGRLDEVRKNLEKRPELLRLGPWAVAYAIADHIVDDYLVVIGEVEDDVEEVEESVFARGGSRDIQRVYQLKRELMELRRAVIPMSRPIALLASDGGALGGPDVPIQVREFFRDVEDHLARVSDQVNAYDELLSAVLDATLAQVSIRQNDDMRKISAWVAIVAVPTMIAGIYGMNFRHMPELNWRFGYPAALLVMLVACVLLYRAFRRSGWL
jgi:magnesium transporter